NQAQGFKPSVWMCSSYGFPTRKVQAVVHKQNKRVAVFVRYTIQYRHCTMSCSQETIMPMVLSYFFYVSAYHHCCTFLVKKILCFSSGKRINAVPQSRI